MIRDAPLRRRLAGLLADPLARQFATFVMLGFVSVAAHYSVLIGLVEGARLAPVPASLAGYVAGGIVSYTLNRRITFRSTRPHGEATWRFVAVASVGFGVTWLVLSTLHHRFALPYLPAQVLTTGIVLFWNFSANKLWTFKAAAIPPVG